MQSTSVQSKLQQWKTAQHRVPNSWEIEETGGTCFVGEDLARNFSFSDHTSVVLTEMEVILNSLDTLVSLSVYRDPSTWFLLKRLTGPQSKKEVLELISKAYNKILQNVI